MELLGTFIQLVKNDDEAHDSPGVRGASEFMFNFRDSTRGSGIGEEGLGKRGGGEGNGRGQGQENRGKGRGNRGEWKRARGVKGRGGKRAIGEEGDREEGEEGKKERWLRREA